MTQAVCPFTGQPLPPGRTISTEAVGWYRNRVLGLGDLFTDLEAEIARQSHHGPPVRNGPRATSEKPLPFHPGAADAAWATRNTILTWTVDTIKRRGDYLPPKTADDAEDVEVTEATDDAETPAPQPQPKRRRTTWHDIERYLIRTAPWAATQTDGPQLMDEVTYALAEAWRAVDNPEGRTIPTGKACLEPGCDGQYTVRLVDDQTEFPPLVCDRDREHWLTLAQWENASLTVTHPEAAARLVASIVGVSP